MKKLEILVRIHRYDYHDEAWYPTFSKYFFGACPTSLWADANSYADFFAHDALTGVQHEESMLEKSSTVDVLLPANMGMQTTDPDYEDKLRSWAAMYDAWDAKWTKVARKGHFVFQVADNSVADDAENARNRGLWIINVLLPARKKVVHD